MKLAALPAMSQNSCAYAPEPQLYVPRAQLPRKMDMTLSLDVLVGSSSSGPAEIPWLLRRRFVAPLPP